MARSDGGIAELADAMVSLTAIEDSQTALAVIVKGALCLGDGQLPRAAALLGISRDELRAIMEKIDIPPSSAADCLPGDTDTTVPSAPTIEQTCTTIEDTYNRCFDAQIICRGMTASLLQLVQQLDKQLQALEDCQKKVCTSKDTTGHSTS